jgi:hypothetical protein
MPDRSKPKAKKLYFFAGRRTGISATSAAEARKKCRRGCGKLVSTRSPTASESKVMAKGGWARGGPKGEKPGYNKAKRGFGPKPKQK